MDRNERPFIQLQFFLNSSVNILMNLTWCSDSQPLYRGPVMCRESSWQIMDRHDVMEYHVYITTWRSSRAVSKTKPTSAKSQIYIWAQAVETETSSPPVNFIFSPSSSHSQYSRLHLSHLSPYLITTPPTYPSAAPSLALWVVAVVTQCFAFLSTCTRPRDV